MTAPMHAFAAELGLDPEVFENSACFITAVRTGVSGKVLQQALALFENRQLFEGALNTDLEGLKEYGSATPLNAQQSESYPRAAADTPLRIASMITQNHPDAST